jgi:hypothetical protein
MQSMLTRLITNRRRRSPRRHTTALVDRRGPDPLPRMRWY